MVEGPRALAAVWEVPGWNLSTDFQIFSPQFSLPQRQPMVPNLLPNEDLGEVNKGGTIDLPTGRKEEKLISRAIGSILSL